MCLGFGRRPWWPCCRSVEPFKRMPTGAMACLVDCTPFKYRNFTDGVMLWFEPGRCCTMAMVAHPLSSFSDGCKVAVRNPLQLLVTNPHPCTSYSCTLGVLPWVTCTITPNGIPAQHLNRSKELMRCHADSFVTAPPILTYDKAVQLTSPYSQANRGKPLSACLTDTSPGRVDDDTFTVTSNSLLKLV